VANTIETRNVPAHPPRPHAATESERAAHDEFMQQITDPVWRD
jgi:hypothetical protein